MSTIPPPQPSTESDALRASTFKNGIIIVSDQTASIPALSQLRVSDGTLTLGYAKRRDKRIGEDYLCAYFDNERLLFAVADGITGGHASHVAARIVANNALAAMYDDEDLVARLNMRARAAVRSDLPPDPRWRKAARSMIPLSLRGPYTSRTMLGCGALDLRTRRLRLRSFGDILTSYKQGVWQGAEAGLTCDQWCSRYGVDPKAVTDLTAIVDGVAAFSDGLIVPGGIQYAPCDPVTEDILCRNTWYHHKRHRGDDCSIIRYEFDSH